jgi:uncharacterized membrane protein YbhN (UPF0104 family)
VDRVVDAVAIILVVWFALRGLALPQALRVVRILLEVGVGVAIAGGLVVIIRRVDLVRRLQGWTAANPVSRRIRSVGLDVVQAIGWVRPKAMMVAMAAALAAAVVNVAAYWLMLRAYHINLSWIQAAGLFAIVMVGTFLPGTPGNVGSWQFFCTIGLQLFGVAAAKAAGFSIVAYFIWTIPPLLIGFVALVFSPFSWSELRTRGPEPPIQVGGVCETGRRGKKSRTGGDAS